MGRKVSTSQPSEATKNFCVNQRRRRDSLTIYAKICMLAQKLRPGLMGMSATKNGTMFLAQLNHLTLEDYFIGPNSRYYIPSQTSAATGSRSTTTNAVSKERNYVQRKVADKGILLVP